MTAAQKFAEVVGKLDRACAGLIDRDTPDSTLLDARCLITSALMRATGVSQFLAHHDWEHRGCSVENCLEVRQRVYEAFGAPGDWGGEIGQALREMYGFEFEGGAA